MIKVPVSRTQTAMDRGLPGDGGCQSRELFREQKSSGGQRGIAEAQREAGEPTERDRIGAGSDTRNPISPQTQNNKRWQICSVRSSEVQGLAGSHSDPDYSCQSDSSGADSTAQCEESDASIHSTQIISKLTNTNLAPSPAKGTSLSLLLRALIMMIKPIYNNNLSSNILSNSTLNFVATCFSKKWYNTINIYSLKRYFNWAPQGERSCIRLCSITWQLVRDTHFSSKWL